MKRLLAVLMICVLVFPIGVRADATMDIADLGEGWRYEISAPTGGPLETWESRHTLFGPDGARVLMFVHDIGDSISDRGYEWSQLLDRLSIYAGYHAFGLESDPNPGVSNLTGVPEGTADAVRDEYIDDFGEPLGYGIYAIDGTRIAIMVIVEGTVNDLTGVAAADYVAGLYFATLSDQ